MLYKERIFLAVSHAKKLKLSLPLDRFLPTELGDRVLSCGEGEQLGHPGRTTTKKPRAVGTLPEGKKIMQVGSPTIFVLSHVFFSTYFFNWLPFRLLLEEFTHLFCLKMDLYIHVVLTRRERFQRKVSNLKTLQTNLLRLCLKNPWRRKGR